MCVCVRGCVFVCACMHMCVCVYVRMYVCVRSCVCVCACMYARVSTCMHAYVYVHAYSCVLLEFIGSVTAISSLQVKSSASTTYYIVSLCVLFYFPWEPTAFRCPFHKQGEVTEFARWVLTSETLSLESNASFKVIISPSIQLNTPITCYTTGQVKNRIISYHTVVRQNNKLYDYK